ncbi:MAG: HAMP domain-containing protein [Acidobacteria bacterium]|nr:HAMP domain-containing protein [Acidobacteriota bacterium]
MRLGIKAKQVAGVVSIVGAVVVGLSAIHLSSLARVQLHESHARGDLLAQSIFQLAREVVKGKPDPYAALRNDPGLRAIFQSALSSPGVTYAAIVDPQGVAVAHSDSSLEGRALPTRGDLDALLGRSALAQLGALYSDEGRDVEVRQPIFAGNTQFGTIRIGINTVLIRGDIEAALRPALITAVAALVVSVAIAMLLAQVMLRPIHVIRSGLTRLGRGEFGVKLDLPQQDEFGELGSFFNAVSAQLSADRTELAGQKTPLESAVEYLEDAVAIVNPDGELLFANPAMRAVFPPDPSGRPVDDLLPSEHPYRRLLEETLATRQSRGPLAVTLTSERGMAPPEGERLIMTHAIKDHHDHLVGVMLVARDLDYLSRVQSTIAYSRKLVALGRLSAGVAHEVKNPLNAMTIHLELLKQKLRGFASGGGAGGPTGAAYATASGAAAGVETCQAVDVSSAMEHLTVIANEIRRLDQVMQGFLKFTRPEDLRLQPMALQTLLKEVAPLVEPEAQKAGVELRVHCPAGLPDINGDPAMLKQVFLNLALNACQAMPNGGVLRIGCAPIGGRRVEISFEDTGTGIKPEHLQKIFDLYFTTKEHGSGIGLSMVYRIVQLHDGEIEVQSTFGHGSTFRLVLPQA